MANLPSVPTPTFPGIYELAIDDPVAGGPDGVDNLPHKQLAERTEYLKRELDGAKTEVASVDSRLRMVEASSVGAFGRALPLSWDYSDEGFDFELFAEGASWRDLDPIDVIETVAGDESVDVSSTNGLKVGGTYVIYTGAGIAETVVVDQILTARRFLAAAPLAVSLAGAKLSRSSFEIREGFALARNGDVFYSRRINVLRFYESGRAIIRRDTGDGALKVAYRSATAGGAWQDAPLVETMQRAEGSRDEEYRIGVGGIVELRVTSSLGPSGAPIRVSHLVVFTEPTAGRAEIVSIPANVTPANGATGLGDTPILTGSAYRSLYGVAQSAAQFRIATDPTLGTIVYDSGIIAAGTSHTVPAGRLAVNTAYFWQARYRDADGVWSAWSKPTGFSTGAIFKYIARPQNIAPAGGATGAKIEPTLQASAFSVIGGSDTHSKSQWQVATDAGFASIAYDSGESMGLTSQVVPSGELEDQTTYYFRVRYKGTALGFSEWSAPTAFTTQARPAAPTNTSPANGATGVARVGPLTSSGFFVPGGSDSHTGSQWQISTNAGFTAIVHDSGDSASLTSYSIPAGANLANLTTYYWRVRHKGAATGYSDWSAATSFQTVIPSGSQDFTTPGASTFTVPANVTRIKVTAIGGGGGGGAHGGGGGGGGGGVKTLTVTPGQQFTVTVGAGGTGSGYNVDTAQNGGSSSFGGVLTATGGTRGLKGTSHNGTVANAGAGGTATGADIAYPGGNGGTGGNSGQTPTAGGAGSNFSGGGGGGGSSSGNGAAGGNGGTLGGGGGGGIGTSAPGGGGGSGFEAGGSPVSTYGGNGGKYGGGGGSTDGRYPSNGHNGIGASGIVRVEWGETI